MKTFFNILALVLVFSTFYGQTIGINSTGAVADNSAMLDVVATDKGLLIPRVDIVDLNTAAPIAAPLTSLLVYNTNATSGVGYYFWDGAKWVKLMDSNTNADHDWYEVGGTVAPNDINDNIFTQGNVGIGEVNPLAQLDVVSSNSLIGLSITKTTGNLGQAQLFLDENRNGNNAHAKHIQFANGASPNVELGTLSSASGLEFFFIDVEIADVGDSAHQGSSFVIRNNGNIGVGTTNPTRKLHISGSGIGVQKFKIEETSVGGESMSLGNGTAASTLAFSNTGDFWLGGVANVDNNMLATDADIFIEGATGNTGIGTSTPQAKLNIPNVGTITTGDWTQASLLIGDATTGLAMDFNEIYTKASTGLLVGAHSNAPILFVTNATTKMRVTATGDVGIGVTVPTEKLHVAGNILASGTITSSDIRYKKEVSKLENSSNLLLELNPVSYYFKSQEFKEGQFDDRKHFGLIAQDVEKILPNLVYEDNDGYKAINYTEIIALLIKSNQELQNRIEALERQ